MSDDERSNSADAEPSEFSNPHVLTVRISPSLNEQINTAIKRVGLKQADVLRKALERGLPVLVSQLNPEGV